MTAPRDSSATTRSRATFHFIMSQMHLVSTATHSAEFAPGQIRIDATFLKAGFGSYPDQMLDLNRIHVEEIATALADQSDYDHRWLIDSRTGEVAFWTSDTGIDGENAVEIDELDLIPIHPLPSYVWYQDMVDFAQGITDHAAGGRFARVLQGKGAFRRFKNQLYEHHPELISAWHGLSEVRAQRRAVEWLFDQEVIDSGTAEAFAAAHPDPDLP